MIIEYGPAATVQASVTIKIWPNAGYRWKLMRLTGYLTSGTGVGTRSALAYVLSGYTGAFPDVPAIEILDESSTAVSTTTNFNVDFTTLALNPEYHPIEISDADAVQISITLLSGDSLYYVLTVDQVLQ